jgi:NADH-quinone oxidoreductase subunit L
MADNLFTLLLVSPLAWMALLALCFFAQVRLPEKLLSDAVRIFSLYMVSLALGLAALTFAHSPSFLLVDFADWIHVGAYHFKLRFIVDLLGATYALLAAALVGVIFRFSRNYLHREPGYFRFIFLLSTLLFGLIVVSFSRSIDLLFIGWELVGTTSVLLISYFYDKPQPVAHATRAIVSYRLCDMGILAAAAWAHLYLHSTDFVIIPKVLDHAHGGAGLLFIGLFVIWASLAKAGQLPMSSWLPAAMEGPTPSSAIFYGALSVHLGPFLLLRFHDYFTHFPVLLVLVGVIGAASALYATLVCRTRSDAKTMLAFATISQVGLIYIEIALGFTDFALFHIVTHASQRTYQFLRSSSLIQDFYENPAVEHNRTIRRHLSFEKFFPEPVRRKVYVHALHGFHLDYFTRRVIAGFLLPMRIYMNWESRWMEFDTRLLKLLLRKKQ